MILSLGTFFGYVGIQSGAADQSLTYLQGPVVRIHKPLGHEVVEYLKTPVSRRHQPWGVKAK
jgi:hypothetical protein